MQTNFKKSIKYLKKLALISATSAVWSTANAELIDRGGGLIYDTVLNVTWLQDVSYAYTTGYPVTGGQGRMGWAEAMAWAAQLEYYDSVRGVMLSDWRLPNLRPLNGSFIQLGVTTGGNTDDGYNITAPGTLYAGSTASELAYMYYNTLGNVALCPITGWSFCADSSVPRSPPLNSGPFIGLVSSEFWTSSNEAVPFPNDAWAFAFGGAQYGLQGAVNGWVQRTAWAVRDGDVALVPEIGTRTMFLVALAAMSFWQARRRRPSRE